MEDINFARKMKTFMEQEKVDGSNSIRKVDENYYDKQRKT